MDNRFVRKSRGENYTPGRNMKFKEEPLTPNEQFGEYDIEEPIENLCGTLRKSLSLNDVNAIRNDFMKHEFEEASEPEEYAHYRRPTCSNLELSRVKFVSVAEAIYHYQTGTPTRFRMSRAKTLRDSRPLTLTVPQSPMLRCRTRSRPSHILSQKEREEMEIEELKKYKIKAQPIPKSVIEGVQHLPPVTRKPATVPEPFNLTEIVKKPVQVSPKQDFKARPAPKHILEKAQIPVKPPTQVTKPISPKFNYKPTKTHSIDTLPKNNVKDTHRSTDSITVARPDGKTHPVPFSFEKRDEELKKRKEERIKRQIAEEKQMASQFKAKEIPKIIKKQMHMTTKKSMSTTSSENKENHHFEAKPATVLYKEPFKPSLQSTHVTNLIPFALNSDKRAIERRQYDMHLKEKWEEMERLKKEQEEKMMEIKKKEIAELRAQQVHHAKPPLVKSPYIPQKSQLPITVPETPKFIRRLQQNTNELNQK